MHFFLVSGCGSRLPDMTICQCAISVDPNSLFHIKSRHCAPQLLTCVRQECCCNHYQDITLLAEPSRRTATLGHLGFYRNGHMLGMQHMQCMQVPYPLQASYQPYNHAAGQGIRRGRGVDE